MKVGFEIVCEGQVEVKRVLMKISRRMCTWDREIKQVNGTYCFNKGLKQQQW